MEKIPFVILLALKGLYAQNLLSKGPLIITHLALLEKLRTIGQAMKVKFNAVRKAPLKALIYITKQAGFWNLTWTTLNHAIY